MFELNLRFDVDDYRFLLACWNIACGEKAIEIIRKELCLKISCPGFSCAILMDIIAVVK